MSKVKNQHTVPQSYLRFFADPQEKLFVFDKLGKKTFLSNVRNVAADRFFYDFPEEYSPSKHGFEEIPDQFVEKVLGEYDGRYPKQINNIISTFNLSHPDKVWETPLFTKENKVELAVLLSIQIFRTREFRDFLSQGQEKITKMLIDRLMSNENPDYNPDALKVEIKKDLLPIEQARFLIDPEVVLEMTTTLMKHIWTVGVNLTDFPFYTSDNPVVKYANREDPYRSFNGYGSEGIAIYYPLNSKFMLSLFEREYFEDAEILEDYFLPIENVEYVKHFNSLQISECQRQVFCREDKFEMAFEFCRMYPEACKEDKHKISIYSMGREY
ncbi:DUF4238 domain-containing protein [Brevibacillus halotolerans]|nr:DUF4238 domain-containing protein [Brevibacillus halotolerans]